jgi:hypothetical protein
MYVLVLILFYNACVIGTYYTQVLHSGIHTMHRVSSRDHERNLCGRLHLMPCWTVWFTGHLQSMKSKMNLFCFNHAIELRGWLVFYIFRSDRL